jgi:hypothetical protein
VIAQTQEIAERAAIPDVRIPIADAPASAMIQRAGATLGPSADSGKSSILLWMVGTWYIKACQGTCI